MVKCILDGQEIEVEPGTTILNAARAIAIDIPTFCYQDRLSISASCRMCLVEIEGRRKLEPACATAVGDDMVIHSHSKRVVGTREDMLEILLANHPLDCPICDKGGECELQNAVYEYGKGDSRLYDPKRVFRTRDIDLNAVIVFNADRCIQCQRCVRVCEEVVGDVALGTAERGLDSEITGVGNSLKDCSHCGNCIEVCPVGALMSIPYRYKARPWDLVKTETICGMCGTGCSLTVETREGEFKRVKSNYDTGINGELLCAKGRFGFDAIDGGVRVREPMIRKNGVLTPVSWDEAIGFISNRAGRITDNGGHIQGLISPRQTNESGFMFQKLMRKVFRTEDIHSSCRFSGLRTNEGDAADALACVIGTRADRKPLQDVLKADCIFLLGSNITDENPVTGYLIRTAVRDHQNQLIIASSRPCGLDDIAETSLRLLPGQEAHLLSALTNGDLDWGADAAKDFVATAKAVIETAGSVALLVGTEFLRSTAATACLRWIAQAVRNIEADGKTVFLQFLFDRPNQLGLWDMGCLPGIHPGWHRSDGRQTSAGSVPDMYYVLGADPVRFCPQEDPCETAALKTDCLVVHTSHMSKTNELATVLLPAPAYGEENGTYTNNEGRVQQLQRVRAPDVNLIPSRKVFNLIAAAMGCEILSLSAKQVFAQIKTEVSGYESLYELNRDNDLGLTTPLPITDGPKMDPARLPGLRNASGKDYYLITGDNQFHSGSFSECSKVLSSLSDGRYIELNPGDTCNSELEGQDATVTRDGVEFTARLKFNRAFGKNVIYVPENFLTAQEGWPSFFSEFPLMVTVVFPK